MNLNKRLEEIKARLNAATSGPLKHYQRGNGLDREIEIRNPNGGVLFRSTNYVNMRIDGELFANAPTDLEFLVEALEIAMKALNDHILFCTHDEADDNYRPLGSNYGWCSRCQSKVGYKEDTAKEALDKIQALAEGRKG